MTEDLKILTKSIIFSHREISVRKYKVSLKMRFDIVNLYYPNDWRKVSKNKDCFSWFLCSHRILDTKTNLYYVSVSPNVQFFSPETGESLVVKGERRGGNVDMPKLVILSDPHNKKVLSEKGISVGCDSDRSVLSVGCKLVRDRKCLKRVTKKVIKLGYNGSVIRHKNCKTVVSSEMPVCQEVTFVFRKEILKEVGNDCGVIRYAKKHNSKIRKTIKEFPTCQEIDRALEKHNCSIVSRVLYEYITEYVKK